MPFTPTARILNRWTYLIGWIAICPALLSGCTGSQTATTSGPTGTETPEMSQTEILTDEEVDRLNCPDLCFFGVVYRTDPDTSVVTRAYVDTDPRTTNALTNDDGSFILSGLSEGARYEITASFGGQLVGSVVKTAERGDGRVISIYLGTTGVEIPAYERGETGDSPTDAPPNKRTG